jgi:hypothetical protein
MGKSLMLPPAVLWLDPGGMTGFALLERGKFSTYELPFQETGNRIYAECSIWKTALAIGWERWRISEDTHKTTPEPEAMHVIGVARWLSATWHCQVLQPAAPGDRDVATPAMLHLIGWWRPGLDDAQSASQHMLAWLLRTGNLPPEQARILAAARQH